MAVERRVVHTPEGLQAERTTRGMVSPFLVTKGFTQLIDSYDSKKVIQTQTIQATDPAGHSVRIRVKLCWHSRETTPDKSLRYAAQLTWVKNGDSKGSVEHYVEGALHDQMTQFMFLVREKGEITHCALVPIGELASIWCAQKEIYDELISQGRLSRRKMNPAVNGSSPTLWLQDDEAQEVVDALWKHKGVEDIVQMRIIGDANSSETTTDDTFDDLPGFDYSLFGSDGAPRVPVLRSSVKRDQRVRAEVLRRARGGCERAVCGTTRNYSSFFDVHHILGADVSDRVYNCVALCPNCHREAHCSPNHDAINKDLLDLAMRFKQQ